MNMIIVPSALLLLLFAFPAFSSTIPAPTTNRNEDLYSPSSLERSHAVRFEQLLARRGADDSGSDDRGGSRRRGRGSDDWGFDDSRSRSQESWERFDDNRGRGRGSDDWWDDDSRGRGRGRDDWGRSFPVIMPSGRVTFDRVEPIFAVHCVRCHAGPQAPQGLRLDRYDSVVEWRERAWIVPGSPGASELVRRVRGHAWPAMPLHGPYLSPVEIGTIEAWVLQGARTASGMPAPVPTGARVRLNGNLTSSWSIDGFPLRVDGASRLEPVQIGSPVEVRGIVQPDGSIRVERIRGR
jgi:hypothetical protein